MQALWIEFFFLQWNEGANDLNRDLVNLGKNSAHSHRSDFFRISILQ